MTERSYFHDGAAENDAQYAPYTPTEYARLTNIIHATSGKYVLPDVLNNLEVTYPGTTDWGIEIDTGAAFIEGYWYKNTSTISLDVEENTADYGRWDRVVIEVDTEAETAEARILRGVPGEKSDPPELNTCTTKLQLPLARIYVLPGAGNLSSYYVHDERHFANNAYHQNHYTTDNDFPNHRFLGWGDSKRTGITRTPMPGWIPAAGAGGSAIRAALPFDDVRVGRSAYNYYAQDRGDGWEIPLLTNENTARMTTLRFLIQVDFGRVDISFGGVTYYMPPGKTPQEIIIRAELSGYQTLRITNNSDDFLWSPDACIFTFGDFRLSQGYVIASEQNNFEQYIFYNAPVFNDIVENSYLGVQVTTELTSGDYVWIRWSDWGTDEDALDNIISDFTVPRQNSGITSYILRVRINDSGSSAANVYAPIGNTIVGSGEVYVYISGVPNDEPRWITGIIAALGDGQQPQAVIFGTELSSSGAKTLDLEIGIIGVII